MSWFPPLRRAVALILLLAAPALTAAAPRMVAAAHPLAVDAGLAVLDAGGHALDAAVAVQKVLGVVEPSESGVGGGGFLLYFNAADGRLTVYDGRETAPSAARPDRFQFPGGLPWPLWLAVPSGRSIGVPGLTPMLAAAHAAHGRLPWPELLAPAIEHAEHGVAMAPRLRRLIGDDPSLWLFPDMRRRFVIPARDDPPRMASPALAATLRRLAEDPGALRQGELAASLVAGARRGWPLDGDLKVEDLAAYRVIEREPVCGRYRGYRVCGVGPPSSGGIALLQILGMLAHFDLAARPLHAPESLHLIAEASRLAFADRERYIGDPAFVDVPVDELLATDYLAARAALIDPQRAMRRVPAGAPPRARGVRIPQRVDPEQGTTHFSIVDADGNAVALTSSIEAPFGSRRIASGMLLNNQLTDFSFRPTLDGRPHPNAVAPGKRPRSSMSPTLVFDGDGALKLVLGSRGGSRIIGYTLKVLLGVLDWQLPVDEALALGNALHRGDRLELEADTDVAAAAPALQAMGHRVRVRELVSGVHAIQAQAGGWRGAADPRQDGVARGH